MTETRPEFHVVPPPADGLAEAFRAAATRRRRKAATTGGAGVTAAVLVLAALTGSTGQVLTQEPAPPAEQPSVVELVPEEREQPRPEVSAPAADDTPSQVLAQAPTRTSGSPFVAGPQSRPAPERVVAVTPPKPPASSYRARPMTRTSYDVRVPLVNCGAGGSTELCSDVTVSSGVLFVILCNQGVEPARLDFAALDEVDVEVRFEGETVWRWAVGRGRVSDPHQVPLPVSRCLEWTTPWTAVDQSGATLPKGRTFTLAATIDSPDAGRAAKAVGTYYS